ncbi:hypothetical protein D4R78_04270 [bacterium]|nr:MAG: hypothetical protein D4R78_04270 [bacterium]
MLGKWAEEKLVILAVAILLFYPQALNAEPIYQEGIFEDNSGSAKKEEVSAKKPQPADEQEDELPGSLDTHIKFMPSSGVKSQSGRVEMIEQTSDFSYDFKVADKLPVTFLFNQSYIKINKTVSVPLPAYLTGVGMGLETTLPFFFNNTYLRIGAIPSFYSDGWHFRPSVFRMTGRLFLIYKPDKKWIYVLGAGVWPSHNVRPLPIVGFIYRPSERWTFNITPDNPNIAYMMSDKATVFVEGFGSEDEYEVTRNNEKNVVLKYREMHAGTGLRYKFNKFIQCTFSVGGMFNRSFKYKDDQDKVSIKDGLYTDFRIEINM